MVAMKQTVEGSGGNVTVPPGIASYVTRGNDA